jgi:acyl-coenzyme A synthetase/AMP-(fatty) acid ligase
LRGRQDDLLIVGGENVYPEMLEARILQCAGVLECAVRGVPDAEYGQALQVFVVLSNQTAQTDVHAELRLLFASWPRFLRPQAFAFLPELPRNAIGKLQRHRLPVI